MIAAIKAFALGVYEFRTMWTTSTNYPDVYDRGRELAHRLTFRQFEEPQ